MLVTSDIEVQGKMLCHLSTWAFRLCGQADRPLAAREFRQSRMPVDRHATLTQGWRGLSTPGGNSRTRDKSMGSATQNGA